MPTNILTINIIRPYSVYTVLEAAEKEKDHETRLQEGCCLLSEKQAEEVPGHLQRSDSSQFGSQVRK